MIVPTVSVADTFARVFRAPPTDLPLTFDIRLLTVYEVRAARTKSEIVCRYRVW